VEAVLLEPQSLAPLVLTAAGFLRRGREWRTVWLTAAVAATAILYPALLVPHGVPSPSAVLSTQAPWRAASAPPPATAGNPELGDLTNQVEPWLLFFRAELRAGRLPFWNPHQSAGAPYWSNGSSAPLFPLHWLFALLPLELGFLLLPWLRVVIGATGTFYLARRLGIGLSGALFAGVAYPLSGRLTGFLLFPMANALCLVPWILLVVERIVEAGEGRASQHDRRSVRKLWATLAALAALQLVAGHPETAFFTAAVAGVYLAARGVEAPRATWARVVSAWIAGLLVAGAALVPLGATLVATERWQEWHAPERLGLATLARLALRFFLPDAFGEATDGSYWGPFLDVPTSVYAGAIAIPLAIVALFGRARGERLDRRLRALAAVVAVCLAGSFHLPGVRELLLVTPVVQKMLHHYLLLGVELGLALLAGAGLERLLAGGRRALVAAAAGVALSGAALALAWIFLADDWSSRGVLGDQATASAVAIGLPLLLFLLPGRAPATRRTFAALFVAATAADLVRAHARSNPGLPVEAIYAETPAIAFLRDRPERLAATGSTLRPNAAMALGLFDIRGDDSLKLSLYERVYGHEIGTPHPTYFRPVERWESAWLDRLGVRWVMAPPQAVSPAAGWSVAYSGPDATIFERPAPLPLVRRASGEGEAPTVERRLPGRWEIRWPGTAAGKASGEGALLVVAETWDPGWSATFDGRPLGIDRADDLLLAVRPGASPGRVVLAYHPAGFAWGVAASGAGLAWIAFALVAPAGAGFRTRERGAPDAPGRAAS
jgi:hypothetical protein